MTRVLPSKLLNIFIACFPFFPSFSLSVDGKRNDTMIRRPIFFFHGESFARSRSASFLGGVGGGGGMAGKRGMLAYAGGLSLGTALAQSDGTAKEQPRRVVAIRALLPRNIRQPLSARRSFSGGIG